MKCETIRILIIALTLLYSLPASTADWSWSVVPILGNLTVTNDATKVAWHHPWIFAYAETAATFWL